MNNHDISCFSFSLRVHLLVVVLTKIDNRYSLDPHFQPLRELPRAVLEIAVTRKTAEGIGFAHGRPNSSCVHMYDDID